MKYLFLLLTAFVCLPSFALRYGTAQIITSASMIATIDSIGIDTNQQVGGAIQAVWSGNPNGTLKIQVSNDNVLSYTNVINWTDYTGSSQSLTGSSGNFVWNLLNMGYRWIRLVYTFSSGSGTLNAVYSGKGV